MARNDTAMMTLLSFEEVFKLKKSLKVLICHFINYFEGKARAVLDVSQKLLPAVVRIWCFLLGQLPLKPTASNCLGEQNRCFVNGSGLKLPVSDG